MTGVTMYDSVDVANYPAGTELALAYLDGNFPDARAVQKRFPGARVVTVTTAAAGNMLAEVFDCEKGDGNAADAARWSRDKISLIAKRLADPTARPCIYCSRVGIAGYGWPWVKSELARLGVPLAYVDFGIADATGKEHLVAGSVFTQWGQGKHGAYDISITNGVWPRSVPVPTPPATEEDMQLFATRSDGVGFVIASDLTTKKGLPDSADGVALQGSGLYKVVTLEDAFIDSIPDAPTKP